MDFDWASFVGLMLGVKVLPLIWIFWEAHKTGQRIAARKAAKRAPQDGTAAVPAE